MAEERVRLTPAQRRGLDLLGRPGAEAVAGRSIRWSVRADGVEIGTIHAESLLALRLAGLAVMVNGGEYPPDVRQRITDAGRAYLVGHARGGGDG